MGSVHNDLHCWAAKARRQGRDTIEIDVETADRAAEQIVDLSNRVMELEHEIRSTPAADEDRVLSVSDDEISVLLEVLAYAGDEVDNATAANSLFVKAEALAALKSEAK